MEVRGLLRRGLVGDEGTTGFDVDIERIQSGMQRASNVDLVMLNGLLQPTVVPGTYEVEVHENAFVNTPADPRGRRSRSPRHGGHRSLPELARHASDGLPARRLGWGFAQVDVTIRGRYAGGSGTPHHQRTKHQHHRYVRAPRGHSSICSGGPTFCRPRFPSDPGRPHRRAHERECHADRRTGRPAREVRSSLLSAT